MCYRTYRPHASVRDILGSQDWACVEIHKVHGGIISAQKRQYEYISLIVKFRQIARPIDNIEYDETGREEKPRTPVYCVDIGHS